MDPSVLAECSHAQGKEGRAPRSLVPLESPAEPYLWKGEAEVAAALVEDERTHPQEPGKEGP